MLTGCSSSASLHKHISSNDVQFDTALQHSSSIFLPCHINPLLPSQMQLRKIPFRRSCPEIIIDVLWLPKASVPSLKGSQVDCNNRDGKVAKLTTRASAPVGGSPTAMVANKHVHPPEHKHVRVWRKGVSYQSNRKGKITDDKHPEDDNNARKKKRKKVHHSRFSYVTEQKRHAILQKRSDMMINQAPRSS